MPIVPPPTARTDRPTIDEWGFYDPQQAGLAALFARLTGGQPARAAANPAADGTPASGTPLAASPDRTLLKPR